MKERLPVRGNSTTAEGDALRVSAVRSSKHTFFFFFVLVCVVSKIMHVEGRVRVLWYM